MSKKIKFNAIQYAEDDGLPIMEVGNWVQKKYKLVGKYCDIFTSAMREKWNLVYIDLFSGPGYVKNRTSGQIMKNCSMLTMNLPHRFDFHAFNDIDKNSTDALKTRIDREHPGVRYKMFNGDANDVVHEMIDSIPQFPNSKGTLIFAFLDPFSLNLKFDTIKVLGQNQVDILVLHALQMDARRNHRKYIEENSGVVADFTGNVDWRSVYSTMDQSPTSFMKMVTDEFDKSIQGIGYRSGKVKERIKNNSGAGIYYLCFYSKHELGIEFFEKIRKSSNDQYEMF